jgi:hypothetical protein
MSSNSDDSTSQPPRSWVEQFISSENSVRRVLDEVQEQYLIGEYKTAREQLRSLARTESDLFRVAALAVLDADGFYEDLRDQYDEMSPPVDTLESFGSQYADISEEFELVFRELAQGFYNPSPSVARQFRYSEPMSLPRLAFDLYSADLKLCQFEHPPSQALILAGLVVDGVAELLEKTNTNNDEVAQSEIDRAQSIIEQVSQDVEPVGEQLEAVDDVPLDETNNRNDYDTYQDPGVY